MARDLVDRLLAGPAGLGRRQERRNDFPSGVGQIAFATQVIEAALPPASRAVPRRADRRHSPSAGGRCARKSHGGATILPSVVFARNFNYRALRSPEEKRALSDPVAAAVRRRDACLHESELTRTKIVTKSAAERSFLAFVHPRFGKSAVRLSGRLKEFDRVFTAEWADPVDVERLRAARAPIEFALLETTAASAAGGLAE